MHDGVGAAEARGVFSDPREVARSALARGCPAEALAALDAVGSRGTRSCDALPGAAGGEREVSDVPWELWLEAWRQVGSCRELGRLLARAGAGLASRSVEVHRWCAEGLPAAPLPLGSLESLAATEAARAGRAGEAARLHLAAADAAPRVDLRFGHVEAAASLAQVLEDPALSLLVAAFEARLDADVGDDADALARADAVLSEAHPERHPEAWGLAQRVRALALSRTPETPTAVLEAARAASDLLPPWPGAAWGLTGDEASPTS